MAAKAAASCARSRRCSHPLRAQKAAKGPRRYPLKYSMNSSFDLFWVWCFVGDGGIEGWVDLLIWQRGVVSHTQTRVPVAVEAVLLEVGLDVLRRERVRPGHVLHQNLWVVYKREGYDTMRPTVCRVML